MVAETFDALEEALGYCFSDRELLRQALTHSSRKNDFRPSNERLEFLGDAILGKLISEYLYRRFSEYTEGDLTRVKSAVVSRTALTRVAEAVDIGRYLIVARGVARLPKEASRKGRAERGTESGQEKNLPSSLLANAFEAIIAAVFLDGGAEAAKAFVLHHMRPEVELANRNAHAQNFKSALQQITQAEMGCVPVYEVTAEEGPDHVKSFEVATIIAGRKYATGLGHTKKAAEQEATERTLAMLGRLDETGNGAI